MLLFLLVMLSFKYESQDGWKLIATQFLKMKLDCST